MNPIKYIYTLIKATVELNYIILSKPFNIYSTFHEKLLFKNARKVITNGIGHKSQNPKLNEKFHKIMDFTKNNKDKNIKYSDKLDIDSKLNEFDYNYKIANQYYKETNFVDCLKIINSNFNIENLNIKNNNNKEIKILNISDLYWSKLFLNCCVFTYQIEKALKMSIFLEKHIWKIINLNEINYNNLNSLNRKLIVEIYLEVLLNYYFLTGMYIDSNQSLMNNFFFIKIIAEKIKSKKIESLTHLYISLSHAKLMNIFSCSYNLKIALNIIEKEKIPLDFPIEEIYMLLNGNTLSFKRRFIIKTLERMEKSFEYKFKEKELDKNDNTKYNGNKKEFNDNYKDKYGSNLKKPYELIKLCFTDNRSIKFYRYFHKVQQLYDEIEINKDLSKNIYLLYSLQLGISNLVDLNKQYFRNSMIFQISKSMENDFKTLNLVLEEINLLVNSIFDNKFKSKLKTIEYEININKDNNSKSLISNEWINTNLTNNNDLHNIELSLVKMSTLKSLRMYLVASKILSLYSNWWTNLQNLYISNRNDELNELVNLNFNEVENTSKKNNNSKNPEIAIKNNLNVIRNLKCFYNESFKYTELSKKSEFKSYFEKLISYNRKFSNQKYNDRYIITKNLIQMDFSKKN
jgi:hypothetical protein